MLRFYIKKHKTCLRQLYRECKVGKLNALRPVVELIQVKVYQEPWPFWGNLRDTEEFSIVGSWLYDPPH